MAADFYKELFNEGDYPVQIQQQVDTALDINRQVKDSIQVFTSKAESGDIWGATDRLEEAFLMDQYHPQLLAVPLELKKKIEKFTLDMDKVETAIVAEDYGSLNSVVQEMTKLAPDFDATTANAIFSTVRIAAHMHLARAQMAAQSGDTNTAQAEMGAAEKVWPSNPELQDLMDKYTHATDQKSQALTEFDRLVKEDNYRALFDKQMMFIPALVDDQKRQDQLKDALTKVEKAEMALKKSDAMESAGNISGAWETIELAVKELPNDLKLNSVRGELSGKAADFVLAINKAKDAEARSELGASLSWYAVAQRKYPGSLLANDAITRLTKQIFDKS